MSARTAQGEGLGRLTPRRVPAPAAALEGALACWTSASGCSILVGREPAKKAPQGIWLPAGELLLWHLSIAHAVRYPSWDEIAEARYLLVPEEFTLALLLPPPDKYVNEHSNCFHLWQIDDRRNDG